MKNIFWIAALTMMVVHAVTAQEYKVAKNSGRLEITEVNKVTIESYAGNEIIFSSRNNIREHDDRAKGLRAVSTMGLEDNTGLDLSVIDKGDVVEVRQLKKMDGPDIIIKVPKGVVIFYKHTSPHGDGLSLKNIENEIHVSTVHNEVTLDNATGPVTIKTVHGDVDAVFTTVKNAISISSVHGHVDVAIPVASKATLKLGTSHGEVFIDPELKIEADRAGDMIRYSDTYSGKMNGGGIDVTLSSDHGNVYLRKKIRRHAIKTIAL